jgi:hypothetical protein
LLARPAFVRRLARHAGFAFGLVAGALAVGVIGYHFLAGLSWVDALLDASMILTGMGPVHELVTTGAKLFASAYALFSGVVFLTVAALVLAPVVHRFLHRFHLDESDEGDGQE